MIVIIVSYSAIDLPVEMDKCNKTNRLRAAIHCLSSRGTFISPTMFIFISTDPGISCFRVCSLEYPFHFQFKFSTFDGSQSIVTSLTRNAQQDDDINPI